MARGLGHDSSGENPHLCCVCDLPGCAWIVGARGGGCRGALSGALEPRFQSDPDELLEPDELEVALGAGLGVEPEPPEVLGVELEESLDPEAVVEEEAPRLSFL